MTFAHPPVATHALEYLLLQQTKGQACFWQMLPTSVRFHVLTEGVLGCSPCFQNECCFISSDCLTHQVVWELAVPQPPGYTIRLLLTCYSFVLMASAFFAAQWASFNRREARCMLFLSPTPPLPPRIYPVLVILEFAKHYMHIPS